MRLVSSMATCTQFLAISPVTVPVGLDHLGDAGKNARRRSSRQRWLRRHCRLLLHIDVPAHWLAEHVSHLLPCWAARRASRSSRPQSRLWQDARPAGFEATSLDLYQARADGLRGERLGYFKIDHQVVVFARWALRQRDFLAIAGHQRQQPWRPWIRAAPGGGHAQVRASADGRQEV